MAACDKENNASLKPGQDIILIIGQSNTHYGTGLSSEMDVTDPGIFQLGRHGGNNMKVIAAQEPLEHHTYQENRIGFGLTFGKEYLKNYLQPERSVLIIPCGFGGTGFSDNRWNKGDDLYNDAINRVNHILKNSPNSRLVAILWHQGERDIDTNYQEALDAMILNMRKDIKDANASQVPFILGGMVPYWVDQDDERKDVERIIKSTPQRIPFTGFADPRKPFVISKPDNREDEVHYDANGQRELGKRYFNEFKRLAE